tara:strand:- start:21982 stop:22308 length:327 start_codon:yes stop_codon:yes gene_type:complete
MTEEAQTEALPVKVVIGRPWTNTSFHVSFQGADEKRNKLKSIWEDDESQKGMQVKVKYMPSRDQFVVKTRLHPDFVKEKKKGKKNVKRGKGKNKSSLKKGKADSQKTG